MSEPVKRTYSSSLRDAQARATRRAIVDAASALYIERGFGGTTVDDIAKAAGVSRKTVFTSVGGKVEALKLALDWAIVGDDEPIPLLERANVTAAADEPDARTILAGFAATVVAVVSRLAPLDGVVQGAAGADPRIREIADRIRSQRLEGCRVVARLVDERGGLTPAMSLDEAADTLWLFNDASVYRRLVLERRWSRRRYEEWLKTSLIAVIIDPAYAPPV